MESDENTRLDDKDDEDIDIYDEDPDTYLAKAAWRLIGQDPATTTTPVDCFIDLDDWIAAANEEAMKVTGKWLGIEEDNLLDRAHTIADAANPESRMGADLYLKVVELGDGFIYALNIDHERGNSETLTAIVPKASEDSELDRLARKFREANDVFFEWEDDIDEWEDEDDKDDNDD